MNIKEVSAHRCFNGWQRQYEHFSNALNCEMKFSIFLPPQADKHNKVPVLYWLSGLTCNDENFVFKAGAQRLAAKLGMAIITPDTSPRGNNVADDAEKSYDLGLGAGFYVNATQAPWAQHYQMYDYVVKELPDIIESNFPVNTKRSISGHSMGGHGALTIALRNPERYLSVSAFAPICNPVNGPWGQKAFAAYLGQDQTTWQNYDASMLMAHSKKHVPALVDQGLDDHFLTAQLHSESLKEAANKNNYPLEFREQEGYDHSYFFIASFINDHLRFHYELLKS